MIIVQLILLALLVIVGVKMKFDKINSDLGSLHEFTGIPQPVILNDNRTKVAQIKFNYYINDKKKAYKAQKYGLHMARILEVGGIQYLRTALGDSEGKSFEDVFPEIENNLSRYLHEQAIGMGLELTELSIKVGEKEEFDSCVTVDADYFSRPIE